MVIKRTANMITELGYKAESSIFYKYVNIGVRWIFNIAIIIFIFYLFKDGFKSDTIIFFSKIIFTIIIIDNFILRK